jgi:hypothetical protein
MKDRGRGLAMNAARDIVHVNNPLKQGKRDPTEIHADADDGDEDEEVTELEDQVMDDSDNEANVDDSSSEE